MEVTGARSTLGAVVSLNGCQVFPAVSGKRFHALSDPSERKNLSCMIDEKQRSVLLWRFSDVSLSVPSSRKLAVSSSNVKGLAEPFRPVVECCTSECFRALDAQKGFVIVDSDVGGA